MAYAKLDAGILDSSLWLDRCAREVFITTLLLAEPFELREALPQYHADSLILTGWSVPPGWYGKVGAAGPGILRRACVDHAEGIAALERLGSPDPDSRTTDFEGRRLVRVNGCYLVLNYMTYRDRDHTAAVRSKRYRDRKASSPQGDTATSQRHGVTQRDEPVASRIADADADADAENAKRKSAAKGWRLTLAEPPAEWIAVASSLGVNNPFRTWDTFRDYWVAQPGAKGRKSDWLATWRNWCRRETEYGTNQQRGGAHRESAIARFRSANADHRGAPGDQAPLGGAR